MKISMGLNVGIMRIKIDFTKIDMEYDVGRMRRRTTTCPTPNLGVFTPPPTMPDWWSHLC
jgi:hypothetical protein